MAQKSPPSTSTHDPQLTINPSAPSSISASQSNTAFTPRSSTFPDGLDSDSEFDVLEPTPLHSPGGPQYDDLPPSYDEAQQQALQDARNGIPPLDPNQVDHDLRRLRLSDEQLPRELQSEVWEYRAPNPNLPNQGQRNVPVHQVQNSEQIPVGNMSNDNLPRAAPPDPSTILLNRALEFTRHEPDADVLYAPRLNRCIAIPQENIPFSGRGEHYHRRNGRDTRRQRRGRRGSRGSMNIPGQWPETASTETLQKETANPEDNIRFLRAYAKPLHAHSIRPAEFAEFLDGLNALCQATNSSGELVGEDSNDSLVQNYIKSANEAFFAPRGLKVSLQSFSSLLETSKVPEERGQRAGAIASVIDPTSNAEKRAQALHPWIEALDTNVPSPSAQMVLLQEMGECVRRRNQGRRPSKPPSEKAAPRATESEDTDPPHSIPEPDQAAGHTNHHNNDNHGHPGWGGWGGWGGPGGFRGRGRCGGEGRERGAHRGHPWTPFGPPGHGPFGAPGNTPFGRPSHGPFGAPGNGPFGPHGHGPFGAPGNSPFGPPGFGPFSGTNMGRGGGHSCHSARNGFGPEANCPNNWAAWGESIGKWGEAFGKRVEDWGQQFGQRAEEWGRDFGNRAETWGEGVAGGPSRNWPSPGAASGPAGETERGGSTQGPEGLTGQETGVERQDSNTVTQDTVREERSEKPDHHIKKEAHNDNDDDDDASSISSSDSGSSSDSDSDSDADEDAYPDTHATFLQRIHTINTNFEAATQKGKKPASTLAQERSLAIERASQEKTLADLKIAEKKRKRDIKKALRQTKKEIRKEHRRVKKELKVKHASVDGKGGLKKAKRSKEWRDAKVVYRAKKKELRRAKMGLRREGREGEGVNFGVGGMKGVEGMVWVVVGNLED